MSIARNPVAASARRYDAIILGGGIYGAMLALEASLRGLAVLVLERQDFGGATSFNSLKTIHGGLRHLQRLDARRYREFAREQRWFLEHFPDLVRPLPVLMPLYERGLRRTGAFRAAFLLSRLFAERPRRGAPDERVLPAGRVVSARAVKQHFPAVDPRRLSGGALWYDAGMPDTQRLIVEVLHCACIMGGTVLNYMPATDLLAEQNRTIGVRAGDALHGGAYDFFSGVVVNATGPWSRENARRFDRDVPGLFRASLAWNVLFDRPAPSACAVAVAPPVRGGRTYFLHPWKGLLLGGTGHAPRAAVHDSPAPTPEELSAFLQDINEAVPGLHLTRREILHVFAGFLPAKQEGTVCLSRHARLVDHARHGGPGGLFSISGTRFTAARSVAGEALARIFPERPVPAAGAAQFRALRAARGVEGSKAWNRRRPEDPAWRDDLVRLVREEAVCHLDDLVLRRTSLGDHPARVLEMAPTLCTLFDWDEARCREEVARLTGHFRWAGEAAPTLQPRDCSGVDT